ncbi:MAG: HD domain-containing protein [Bacteriovoracaceae bacterium]|nr:HD domain-containing protein [Bacteriovoracaceae bacterium]
MGHCILIVDDPILENVYSLNLKMYADTDSLIKKNKQDVVNLFSHVPVVDLIITKEKIGDENTADDLSVFLHDTDRGHIPIIVLGENRKMHPFTMILDPRAEVGALVKSVARILGITAKDIANRLVPEFFPISLEYFKNLDHTQCDVFKRSNEANGNSMYFKAFDRNQKFSPREIEGLQRAGVKNLYIPSTERLKFTNFYTKQLVHRLQNTSEPEKKAMLIESAMTSVQEDIGRQLSMDEETIKVANVCIQETMNMINSSQALKHFMKNLLSQTQRFAFQHCQMTTYLAFHMIAKMEWGSEEQQRKLAFVSFFHDIILLEEEHVKVHSQLDLDSLKLTEADVKNIMHHAQISAEIVSKIPDMPIGADQIIRQHHGSHNGVGFPRDFSQSLSPLTIVFMVAEEFAHIFLKNRNDFNFEESMARIRRKFPDKGKWKQIIETLDSLGEI